MSDLLDQLRAELARRDDLVGIYLYGSLTTGDFSPASSDIDVVVMLSADPDAAGLATLKRMHQALLPADPGRQLHCLYVTAEHAADASRLCPYWFGRRMTQWQLKVLTQAELGLAGLARYGPWPPPGVAPVPADRIQAAVRAGIDIYYRPAARRRLAWLRDTEVDHQLVALPRAEAVLADGDLITKTEAIGRLERFGVPNWLGQEIAARRAGTVVPAGGGLVTTARKLRRACIARRIMKAGADRLSRLPQRGEA